MSNKLDTHIHDTNNKHEQLRRDMQNDIKQQQQEQGETVNTLKQKIVK